jgi:23S rRNA (guanosine2251-2'-O)-methyltransferase
VLESLIAARRQFRHVIVLQSAGGDPRLDAIKQCSVDLAIPVEPVDRAALDSVVPGVNHQGVAVLATPYPYANSNVLEGYEASMLALDHLLDPQNVGTLLRAADAFGVGIILLPRDRSAGITPAVVNSSAGAVEYLQIVQLVNLGQELDRLKKSGHWIVGIENHQRADVLGVTPIPTPAVLLIGSEGHGISPNLAKRCDLLLKIEMSGHVNSLNAATAGSIALFELSRS